MKKRRSVIGCMPGYRKLMRSIDDAETMEEQLHLWYSSPLIDDQTKQAFTDKTAWQALLRSPIRRMVR